MIGKGVGDFFVGAGKVTVDVLKAPVDLSIVVLAAGVELGAGAFDALVKEAIAVGDLLTQSIASKIKDIANMGKEIAAIIKDPSKLDGKTVLKYLKKMPVIGDIAKTGEAGYRIASRAISGEKEKCYRKKMTRDIELNAKNCDGGEMVAGQCFQKCDKGFESAALYCEKECKGDFPIACGPMCVANEELCPPTSLVKQTSDVINAALVTVKTAGKIATGNIFAFFSTGLKLIDDFAHPECKD